MRYLCVQVWSSHSAFFGALHVWTSTVFLHSLHRTAQHQWNLHSHWVTRVTRVVSYPRPQHMISHPSVPLEVLLQTRPAVPREPESGKRGENQVTFAFDTPGTLTLLRSHKESLFLKIETKQSFVALWFPCCHHQNSPETPVPAAFPFLQPPHGHVLFRI